MSTHGLKIGVNLKSQSLTEVAVFGAILLMVSGFLLRYGLQYNYQQQVRMEAFRRALNMSAGSNVSKSQEVVLIKDVHFPNQQDIFGQGDRRTIRSSGSTFWSNSTIVPNYATTELSPSVKYVYNPENDFQYAYFPAASGLPWQYANVTREYTTAGLDERAGGIIEGNNATLKGCSTVHQIHNYVDNTRIYQEEDGSGPLEIKVLLGSNCDTQYCQTSILNSLEFLDRTNTTRRYFPVLSAVGSLGSAPTGVVFLDSEGGQLNSALGRQQMENTVTFKQYDNLTLNENSTEYKSEDSRDETEVVEHVVNTSSGLESPTFVFKNTTTKTWTTPK